MTRHTWGLAMAVSLGGQRHRCLDCGLLRGTWRAASLRRLLERLPEDLVEQLHLRWPNADLDHCHVKGLVAYSHDGTAWVVNRPECQANPAT